MIHSHRIMEEVTADSSTSTEEETGNESWIAWFCAQKGNEFFCEVEKEFIEDEFNLAGLNHTVQHYQHALCMLLDKTDIDFGMISLFSFIYVLSYKMSYLMPNWMLLKSLQRFCII